MPIDGSVWVKQTRRRPNTATLDRPVLLDPTWVRKLDMTTLSRERLMTIDNLLLSNNLDSKIRVKKPTHVCERVTNSEEDNTPKENVRIREMGHVLNATFRVRTHQRKGLNNIMPTTPVSPPQPCLEPQDRVIKTKQKRTNDIEQRKEMDNIFGNKVGNSVPEPCRACGRTDQPERLHSHPIQTNRRKAVTTSEPVGDRGNKVVVKNSVSKPIAIKFKSAKVRTPSIELKKSSFNSFSDNIVKKQAKSSPYMRKKTAPAKTPSPSITPLKKEEPNKPPIKAKESEAKRVSPRPSPRRSKPLEELIVCHTCSKSFKEEEISGHLCSLALTKKGARTLTNTEQGDRTSKVEDDEVGSLRAEYCYICGKIFEKDSVLLEIHEKECLAKWQEKNQELPLNLRSQEPVKPDNVLVDVATLDDSFWQQHLTQLVPCHKCGRKFNPERVKVHEKSCKVILSK